MRGCEGVLGGTNGKSERRLRGRSKQDVNTFLTHNIHTNLISLQGHSQDHITPERIPKQPSSPPTSQPSPLPILTFIVAIPTLINSEHSLPVQTLPRYRRWLLRYGCRKGRGVTVRVATTTSGSVVSGRRVAGRRGALGATGFKVRVEVHAVADGGDFETFVVLGDLGGRGVG